MLMVWYIIGGTLVAALLDISSVMIGRIIQVVAVYLKSNTF